MFESHELGSFADAQEPSRVTARVEPNGVVYDEVGRVIKGCPLVVVAYDRPEEAECPLYAFAVDELAGLIERAGTGPASWCMTTYDVRRHYRHSDSPDTWRENNNVVTIVDCRLPDAQGEGGCLSVRQYDFIGYDVTDEIAPLDADGTWALIADIATLDDLACVG